MKRLTAIIFGVFAALLPVMAMAQGELPTAPEVPPPTDSASFFDGMLRMSNETLLLMVAGFVISLVMAIPLQQAWGDDLKALLVFLVCIGFGIVYTLTLDEWSTADLGRRILLVMGAATGFYIFFKGPMQTFTARTDNLLHRDTNTPDLGPKVSH